MPGPADDDPTTAATPSDALEPYDDGSVAAAARRLSELTAELTAATADAAPAAPGTALVPSTLDAVATRQRLAAARTDVMRRRAAVEAAAAELRERAEIARRQAQAALAPLADQLARIEDGIDAVNLYLGRDEAITQIADGDPAPVSEPITVRQLVLSMDQECMVAVDSGGIDASDIDSFVDWLTGSAAHLAQILPEPKGIVALVPRFTDCDYRDPWLQQQMDTANTTTWFLIRNGGRLYLTTCGFRVGRYLIPPRDEFTKIFADDGFGRRLEPGTDAWIRAERRADARQRHYMKTALVIQGLLDRTPVLHPLPAAHVSVLHPESYDAGHLRVVADAELAIGTGQLPFREWLAGLNARLQPGMRIIGAFHGDNWRATNDRYDRDRVSDHRHSRLSPDTASPPPSRVIHTLAERTGDGGFRFRYDRTDKRWGWERPDARWDRGEWGEWPYANKASCVVRPTDRFILPFDLVTVDEMRARLASRTDREEYLSMVPVLKAAIAAKQTEAELEAPFRTLAVGELLRAGASLDEAEAAIGGLVEQWKLANRWHRPLVDPDPAQQTKALRAIVTEWQRRVRNAANVVAGGVVDQLRDRYPDALFIATRTDGTLVVLTASRPEGILDADVFVDEHLHNARGEHKTTKWWRLSGARFTILSPLYTSPRWDRWQHQASRVDHLDDIELAAAAAELAGRSADGKGSVCWVEYCAEQRSTHGRFLVWRVDGDSTFDRDHPLTGRHTSVDVAYTEHDWRRTTGGAVVLDRRHSARRHAPEGWPWRRAAGYRYLSGREVHRDDTVLARLGASEAVDAERERLAEPLGEQVERWIAGLEAAWDARMLDDAYRSFLDEYGAAELWDGHRKTLRLEPFPHRGSRSRLYTLGAHLAEAGVALGTLSPRQALVLADGLGVGTVDVDDRTLDFHPASLPASDSD